MEHDVIAVSTVRASSSAGAGFLSDPRRLNVLLTRARRGLLLVGHAATLLRDPAWAPLLRYLWREGLVQGEGLEPLRRLGAAEEDAIGSGSAAPTFNHPSGPCTWLAFDGSRQARAGVADAPSGGGADGPAAAPPVAAHDWREDLRADSAPGADQAAAKEEEVAKEAAPPKVKRKKPKFL